MLPPLILALGGSLVVAFLGRNQRFGFWGLFFCSLLLTPVIGLLIVLGSHNRRRPAECPYHPAKGRR